MSFRNNSGYLNHDTPLYNSRILNNYAEYLRKFHPDIDIQPILDYAGITIYELEDPGHWFNQHQSDRFHEMLVAKTGQKNISREAGRFSATTKASGAVRQYTMGFVSPAAAYRVAEKIAKNLTRAYYLKTEKLGTNKIEISAIPRPKTQMMPYQCETLLGMLEAVPKLFTNKYAEIEHIECIHRGGDVCRYIIRWDNTSAFSWKRIRNYSLIISFLISLSCLFLIPVTSWIPLVFTLALISLCISLYSEHLQNREMVKTLENQGNAAKDLIEMMKIRNNNAMLVQEIGQATSTILDIERLVQTVVRVMEKRLDFDRGMVMLANQKKTRLFYASGYGYSKDKEDILTGLELHLDKPESRGLFVLTFKDQKPLLVNDIQEMTTQFSNRSMELAEAMNVRSMICVPIVYEQQSLGILAVDNVKSERPLTQSDVSLLMGVASQTAVSIMNALSFQRIQESEKKYRDLVENANSIIMRMDARGTITFFNEFAQKFFGYHEQEIIGANAKTIFPDAAPNDQMIKTINEDPAGLIASEEQNVLKNGEVVYVAWTHKPIFNGEGQLQEILSIGNDVTGLKKAAQEKAKLQSQLKQAQKMEAVGTLAGGIAHDFNNILQAISACTQLLTLEKKTDHPDLKKLGIIQKSVDMATDLTRRLLIFSRKVESALKPVDLNESILHISKMLERIIPKMIDIELRLTANLRTIKADIGQIEQVMMNLGVNARDAMPDGGKLIFETKNVALDGAFCSNHLEAVPGEYALLRVSDTGSGMDSDTVEHIFEPFFTTKDTGKGTGLGLAMVYGIVQSHHGYITCESHVGRGTTFKIYFPVAEKDLKRKEPKKEKWSMKGGKETILLVDDDQNIQKLGEEILTRVGYDVMIARDGESALEIYKSRQKHIDLTILDLIMPGMGGVRCLERLVEINPEAKVLIASGYSVTGNMKESVGRWARGFIGKPYDVGQILHAVREVLDGK